MPRAACLSIGFVRVKPPHDVGLPASVRAVNSSIVGPLHRTLDAWFCVRRAEIAAEALPPTRRPRVSALRKVADARFAAAVERRGADALILARASLAAILAAVLSAEADLDGVEGASLSAMWKLFDGLVASGLRSPLPAALAPAREASAAGQSSEDEVLQHGERRIVDCLDLVRFLAASVETRPIWRLRLRRRLVQVTLGSIGLALALEGLTLLADGPNLAVRATVVSSSRRAGSGPPSDLANGKVEPTFAFATKDEPDPFVTLDLTTIAEVAEVTLINSDDHQDDSLPFRVETSVDALTWEPAAIWATHFSPAAPAVLAFHRRSARFVKIHGKTGGALYLTEVEVR